MTAGSKRMTKENGSIYKSTRERVNSRKPLMEVKAPSDGLLNSTFAVGCNLNVSIV